MQITLDVDLENCEMTESPYWLIIDPKQMLRPDVYAVAGMVTGPFFSRKSAQDHLENRRYAFSKHAVVFCHSGYWSSQYKDACRKSLAEAHK